jgi:hypothetical protein
MLAKCQETNVSTKDEQTLKNVCFDKYKYVFVSNKSTPCFKQIYNRTEYVVETTRINSKEVAGGME